MIFSEDMKQEALERMKILKLNENIIAEFQDKNNLYVSNIEGILQKANDDEIHITRELEHKKKCLIYHIIHLKTESRDILYFLYVDENQKEWKDEKRDLRLGYCVPLVYKTDIEIREIGITTKDGRINTTTPV